MNCCCMIGIYRWLINIGNRVTELEQKVERLENHIIIDIEALQKSQ